MSETVEQLDQLLIEVAELGDFAELVRAADEQPLWWLTEEEGRSVFAEWDESLQRMMFSTEIGIVPDKNRTTALKQALYYNLVWQRTGGARMALIPEDNSLQLMVDLYAEDLSSTQVVTVATNLLQAAKDWRDSWDEPAHEKNAEPTTASGPKDDLPPPGSIQV